MTPRWRVLLGACALIAIVATAPLIATAQTQNPPATGGQSQPTPEQATSVITQALGGNTQAATALIQSFGGDPMAALNAFASGNAGSTLASALGGSGAVNFLTQAMGGANAISALTGALGQSGSLNALIGALGSNNAIGSLAGSLLGNSGAISAIQSVLGGNIQGLQALNSFLGGNTGALGALTSALGGANGALGALTNALGGSGALSALSGALGANGALGALTNALGINGALNALTGALGGQISQLLGGLGLPGLCGIAPLTGTFAVPGCTETTTNRSITYAQEEPGGKEVAKSIEQLHTDQLLPAMKDRTAQVNAGVQDATRQQGSIVDAAQTADAQRDIEREELDARQGLQSHEQSCALPTNGPALAQTQRAGIALARGMVNELAQDANPNGNNTASRGYGAVIAERYQEYCRFFVDPDDNNGVTACEQAAQRAASSGAGSGSTGTGTTGTADSDELAAASGANNDVDVEGILFADTLDIEEEVYKVSSDALLRNLVQPKTYPPLSDEVLNTAAGVEWNVKRERVETVRKIAADVIAAMLARRVGIPLPDMVSTGSAINPMENGNASGQCNVPNEAGDANSRALRFAQQAESSGRVYRNPATGVTLCQRFSWEASGRYLLPSNMGSAVAAMRHFRSRGVLQPWNAQLARPGDIIYLTSVTRNGRLYGHTGIYGGNNRIFHVWSGARVNNTALVGYYTPTRGQILGFVRPSGAGAQVADCTFDHNQGRQPGQPAVVTTGSTAGLDSQNRTGATPSTAPPDRSQPTTATISASTPPPAGTTRDRGNIGNFLSGLNRTESLGNAAICRYNYNGYQGQGVDLVCMNFMACMGRYQFCPHNLETLGRTRTRPGCVLGVVRQKAYQNGRPVMVRGQHADMFNITRGWTDCNLAGTEFRPRQTSDFMNSEAMQNAAMMHNMPQNAARIRAGIGNRMCTRHPSGILITPSGLLAAAHLGGPGALSALLSGGDRCESGVRAGQPGCASYYLRRHGGYTMPQEMMGPQQRTNCPGDMVAEFGAGASGSANAEYNGTGDYYTPPQPRAVRDVIREIRMRAGVPDDEIAEDPSYNEIMLALTKERFFDPRYFSELSSSMPAMQDNEASLNAYISMTLQDIHMLQEQINALVAGRASLKLEELERRGNR